MSPAALAPHHPVQGHTKPAMSGTPKPSLRICSDSSKQSISEKIVHDSRSTQDTGKHPDPFKDAVPLQFPDMCDGRIKITETGMWPPSFPPVYAFHGGHASFKVSVPVSQVRSIHIYAVGALIIDGRKYRVQGWLDRITTLPVAESSLLVTVYEPVLFVSKVECMRDLDGLDGEFHVGRLAILPSGNYRLYAVIADVHDSITISVPTPLLHLVVNEDWELSADGITCVSLADLVALHNPHQYHPVLHTVRRDSIMCSRPVMSLFRNFVVFCNPSSPRPTSRELEDLNCVSEPSVGIGHEGSMKPIRFAELPSRLDSMAPIICGVLEDW